MLVSWAGLGWGWALSPHGSEAQNGSPCFFSRAPCIGGHRDPGLSPLGGPILEKQSVLGSLCGLQPELLWVLVLFVWGWVSLCIKGWPHCSRTLTREWGGGELIQAGGQGRQELTRKEGEAPSQACSAIWAPRLPVPDPCDLFLEPIMTLGLNALGQRGILAAPPTSFPLS